MNGRMRKISSLVICILMCVTIFGTPKYGKPEGSGSYPPPDQGDWVITNQTYVSNETIILNGNLTINETGELWFDNVTLKINCTSSGQYGIKIEGGGIFYVTDSVFTAYNTSNHYFFKIFNKTGEPNPDNNTIVLIYDSNISYIQNGIEIYTDNVTIANCRINNSLTYGISISSSSTVIQKCEIDSPYGIKIDQGSDVHIEGNIITAINHGFDIINSTVNIIGNYINNGCTYDLKLTLGSIVKTLDTIFNKTKVDIQDTSKLIVNWTLFLITVDTGGSPIPNASAVVKDINSQEIFNGTSNYRGNIDGNETTEYIQNSTEIIYHTPHNVTSSNNGYTGYLNVTINKTKYAEVTLPGPNLGIMDGYINISATAGNPTYVNVTVENTGDATVKNITVEFYIGKMFFGEKDIGFNSSENYTMIDSKFISSLASGSNTSISGNWLNPSEGMQHIKVILDTDENTTEVNEKNNEYSKVYYVDANATKPYVVYGYVRDKDDIVVFNATVYVSNGICNVTDPSNALGKYDQNLLNIPTYSTEDTIYVWAVYGNMMSETEEFTPDSSGGKMVNVSFNVSIGGAGGKGGEGGQFEGGENNKKAEGGAKGSSINLIPLSLSYLVRDDEREDLYYDDGNLVCNVFTEIKVLIHNSGPTTAYNVSVQFLDEDQQIGDIPVIPQIPGYGYENVITEWCPHPVGLHNVTVAVDPFNNISESNENDNNITEEKNVREGLRFHLIGDWNKVTLDYLDANFSAGALTAGTCHIVKFITMYDEKSGEYINYIRNFTNNENDFSMDVNDTTFVYFPHNCYYEAKSFGPWYFMAYHATDDDEEGWDDGLIVKHLRYNYMYICRQIHMPYYRINWVHYECTWDNIRGHSWKDTWEEGDDIEDFIKWVPLKEEGAQMLISYYLLTVIINGVTYYYYVENWYTFYETGGYMSVEMNLVDCIKNGKVFDWPKDYPWCWDLYQPIRMDFDLYDREDDEYKKRKTPQDSWSWPKFEKEADFTINPKIWGYRAIVYDDCDYSSKDMARAKIRPDASVGYVSWCEHEIMCIVYWPDEVWYEGNPSTLAGRDGRGDERIQTKWTGMNNVVWYVGKGMGWQLNTMAWLKCEKWV